MSDWLGLFWGGADQIAALGATLTLFAVFAFVGGIAGGRDRLTGAEPLLGWAAAVVVFTVVPVWTGLPYTPLFYALLAAAGVSAAVLYKREAQLLPYGAHRIVVLALPMLAIGAAMTASQWDEFSHWLASIHYLIDNDIFPGAGRPPTAAYYPAYPYGWPLVGYLSAKLGGGYIEGMAPAANVLFLGGFGLVLAYVIKRQATGSVMAAPGWTAAAFGFLGATALSTTFVEKLVLTAYAEAATAAALGLTAVLAWSMAEAARDHGYAKALGFAWQISLIGAALLVVKQANLVLFVCAVGAGLVLLARLRCVSISEWVRLALVMVALPAVVYLSWRYHVTTELPGREFNIRPFDQWNFAAIPSMLQTIGGVILSKGFFFSLNFVLVGFGVAGLIRPDGPFRRFALLAALVFLGYNAFLLFAYVAAFGSNDAVRAASYWRYNTHLGLVGASAAAVGLAGWYRRRGADKAWLKRLGWAVPVLTLILPLAFAKTLRFDIDLQKTYARTTIQALAGHLEPDDRLVVVDPKGTGLLGAMARYELAGEAVVATHVSAYHKLDEARVRALLTKTGATHAWVHSVTAPVAAVFGLPNPAPGSYLVAIGPEGGTTVIAHWPFPDGYDRTKRP